MSHCYSKDGDLDSNHLCEEQALRLDLILDYSLRVFLSVVTRFARESREESAVFGCAKTAHPGKRPCTTVEALALGW